MVYLILGVHNHQPVGNFPHVFEKAFLTAYEPFLNVFERHPGLKLSVHCSGPLIEWLEANRPDYLDRVGRLVADGRVEVIGGAFYEAVLASIPEADQIGQLEKMSGWIERRFGRRPRGAWLAERVWEPHLPKVLAAQGLDYTILDDAHFKAVGFKDRELTGHYLTEFEGRAVGVFPISQKLRYDIPFGTPEGVLEFLAGAGREQKGRDIAFVMADDGEKFGLWPRTYGPVYEGGWLERFFALLEERSSEVLTCTFAEHLERAKPLGWAYLPTGSYAELSEWALGPEPSLELERALKLLPAELKAYLRGGYFRNFLTKYPEASRLYRKMLRVSRKSHALRDGKRRGEALAALWKAQCNCAYWHGVFGGLYLPHLRHAVYENLLKAEAATDAGAGKASKKGALFSKGGFSVEAEDWDADGTPELLVDSPQASWYFAPGAGAGMFEWDLKAAALNLGGILSRRKEAYHSKLKEALPVGAGGETKTIHDLVLAKEPELEKHLVYDWHARMSLLDHFMHTDTRREDFARTRYGEQGDFTKEPFEAAKPRLVDGRLELAFRRKGSIWTGDRPVAAELEKKVLLSRGGGWSCAVSIRPEQELEFWYGLELALAFSERRVGGELDETDVRQKTFVDEARGVSVALEFSEPAGVWSFPLDTVAQSEEGFERTYQGGVVLLHRRMSAGPESPAAFSVSAETRTL